MGMCIFGYGMKLGVVQFIKGVFYSVECDFLGGYVNCDFYVVGEGYIWDIQDCDVDMCIVVCGWDEVVCMIGDLSYDMVILDEFNIVLKYQYFDLEEVLCVFVVCCEMLYIVVIGCYVLEVLIEQVDLVSEMCLLKYFYKEQGVKVQKGVEF